MFGATLGYPDKTALLLAAGCASWFFVTSIVSVIGIDRFFGRRTLTMFSAGGMCCCMITLCVASYINTDRSHDVMSAFLFLYVAFFSIGWQGISYLWSVELIPLSIRGPANALVSTLKNLAPHPLL
jgi:sugar phosphate permease